MRKFEVLPPGLMQRFEFRRAQTRRDERPNVHDAKLMDRLIRDDDTAVYGDKGYASDAKKRAAEAAGVLGR